MLTDEQLSQSKMLAVLDAMLASHHIDSADHYRLSLPLVKKGKRKGCLLKSPPSRFVDVETFLAWQAYAMVLCPMRVSTWGLLCLDSYQKETFKRLVDILGSIPSVVNGIAQLPFEFNTYALNF